jgi:hypothetical protein
MLDSVSWIAAVQDDSEMMTGEQASHAAVTDSFLARGCIRTSTWETVSALPFSGLPNLRLHAEMRHQKNLPEWTRWTEAKGGQNGAARENCSILFHQAVLFMITEDNLLGRFVFV